jgi:hypothetical protein
MAQIPDETFESFIETHRNGKELTRDAAAEWIDANQLGRSSTKLWGLEDAATNPHG